MFSKSGAYGDSIARRFRLERAHSSQVIAINDVAPVAVTRLQCGAAGVPRSLPIPAERALIVILQLHPLADHDLWFGRTMIPVEPWAKGAISVVDLEDEPTARLGGTTDVLQFYLPRTSLENLAAQSEEKAIRNLHLRDGTVDPVVHRLGTMMLPALVRPGDASLLFLSGLSTALYSRLSQCYAAVAKNRNRGWSLTPAELDRAKGLLNENLDGDISLSVIARECQLPVIHFAEAFRRATGLAPHRWLAAQRVASAKRLLARGQRDLAYIASVCGFTNERQMERQFIALVGLTPSHWQNDHIQR